MKRLTNMLYVALVAAMPWAGGGAKADDATQVIKDHRIGFAETGFGWALYQTADGKKECPQGFNGRSLRENLKVLYPNGGPLVDTQLAREALAIFPQDRPAHFPFFEVQGSTGIGLNLDGKIGPKDFTSPDGERGIDNAFYRAIGCTVAFRGPDGPLGAKIPRYFIPFPTQVFNRMMIEITDVDSLQNDDSVEVTIYRGRDPWVTDATAYNVVPGGSQRIDTRFGKKLIQHLHGKIEDGVLITDPVKEGLWPWMLIHNQSAILRIRDMRLRLKLSPTNADGQIGGYFDVHSLYRWVNGFATSNLDGSHIDAQEFYWAIRRNADAYPDKDGVMTAISSAMTVNMTQVYIMHPDAPANKQLAAHSVP